MREVTRAQGRHTKRTHHTAARSPRAHDPRVPNTRRTTTTTRVLFPAQPCFAQLHSHGRVSTPDASCGERAGAGMEAGWWTRWRPPHPSPTYADDIQRRDPRCREGIRQRARRQRVEKARMLGTHWRCYGDAKGEGLVGVLTPTPTTLTPAPAPALLLPLPLPLRRFQTRAKRGQRRGGWSKCTAASSTLRRPPSN